MNKKLQLSYYFIFVLLFSAFSQGKKVFEDAHVTTRSVDKFSQIKVSGPFSVHYSSGDKYDLAVGTSQSSMQGNIITKVRDGVLEVYSNSKNWGWWGRESKVNIYIASPFIRQVTASGAVNFNFHNLVKGEELTLVFSGASQFNGAVNLSALYANFSGASDMSISGKTEKATFKFSGASDASAYSLIADSVQLISTGASSIKITAIKALDAVASGASDIKYKGTPLLNLRSTGASDVSSKN